MSNNQNNWHEFGKGIGGIVVIAIAVVIGSFLISVLWSLAEWWRVLFGWG